eukprot:2014235-Rhodomonas_salina.2
MLIGWRNSEKETANSGGSCYGPSNTYGMDACCPTSRVRTVPSQNIKLENNTFASHYPGRLSTRAPG